MDHQHSLQLKPPEAPYKCSGCGELGFGTSYHCENFNCTYILHQECANPDPFAFHPFFEKSTFEFYKKAPRNRTYCDACGKDVLGFVYHCSKTGYDLHPCCLKLKHIISNESANVTLKLSHKVHSKCAKCKHKNVVRKVKGWTYYDGNSCCYHVSCFKDLILENWRRGYFNSQGGGNSNSNNSSSDDRETQLALTSVEMVQSLRMSRRVSTINKYTKIAVVVFKLIFSAIFGNPISAIATLLEALASD